MTQANVSEIILKFFQAKKTKYAFGILSSGFMELADILRDTDIQYIGTRHEQWAGHIADSYGRLTGSPQMCLISGSPGITNMVSAIATANINHSPVFVLTDGPTTKSKGTGDFQDVDGTTITAPVSKSSVYVSSPSRALDILNSLYNLSIAPLPGPVHVELARDTLLESCSYTDKEQNFDYLIHNLAGRETIESAVNLILESSRPVILAGNEIYTKRASVFLGKIAESLNIPVVTTHSNNDLMPSSNRFMLGAIGRLGSENAMRALAESDLVIAIGTTLNSYTFVPYYGFKYPGAETKIIQVSMFPESLARSGQVKLGIFSNAEDFLEATLNHITQNKVKLNAERYSLWETFWSNKAVDESPTFKGEHNKSVFEAVFDTLPDNSILSLDAGSMASIMVKWKRYPGFGSLLTSGNMGEVGFSIPSAIGAKLARPDSQSYAFLGDGAFTMEMSALITAVEYDIPIKVVVFDNSAWGSEKAYQQEFYDRRFFGSDLQNPDLVNLSQALGLQAFHAEDSVGVRRGLKDLSNSEKPAILIIRTENDYPTPVRSLDAVKRVNRGLFKTMT